MESLAKSRGLFQGHCPVSDPRMGELHALANHSRTQVDMSVGSEWGGRRPKGQHGAHEICELEWTSGGSMNKWLSGKFRHKVRKSLGSEVLLFQFNNTMRKEVAEKLGVQSRQIRVQIPALPLPLSHGQVG